MNLLKELLLLNEDAAQAAKVRMLRAQLENVNRQLDTKQQAGQTVGPNDPLKKRQMLLQQQIDELNQSAAQQKQQ